MEELTPLGRLARNGLDGQTHEGLGHAARFAWEPGIATGEMRYALLWRLLCLVQDELDEGSAPLTEDFRIALDELQRAAVSAALEPDDFVEGARVAAEWIEAVHSLFESAN